MDITKVQSTTRDQSTRDTTSITNRDISKSFQPPSTGQLRVPSPQLRTRDSAVPAGPSPPPVPWREPTSWPTRSSSLSPSNNLLTAQAPMVTKVAMEVLWTTLSNTLRPTRSSSSLSTHTLAETESATPRAVLPRSRASWTLHQTLHRLSLRLSPRVQSPSPSMLEVLPGNSTSVVS